MNLAPHLNFCEKKINALLPRQKVQLYLIPVCLTLFILYNYLDVHKNLLVQPMAELKKNEINTYEFLTKLQEFSLENGLNIVNIKQNGNNFSLDVKGDFFKVMALLLFCETYESVNMLESFKLVLKENIPYLTFSFSFAQHQYERIEQNRQNSLQKLKNPFYGQTLTPQALALKLFAIVNQEALINETWLKVGQTYKEYEVHEIKTHSVMLKKPNNEYEELRLIKE